MFRRTGESRQSIGEIVEGMEKSGDVLEDLEKALGELGRLGYWVYM